VTQRTTEGVLKIIFWYAARGDSCAIRQMNTTEQDGEDFDAWCPMDEVVRLLTFHDDKTTTARVIEAARGGVVPAQAEISTSWTFRGLLREVRITSFFFCGDG